MQRLMNPTRTLGLALAGLLVFAGQPAMAKLYKWVDENGKVHYSDHVPPEAVKQPQSRLNEHGIEVDRKGAAKTAAELERERELERLRKEQARLAEQQRQRDRVLLRTFRTEDDLIMARDGKVKAIDVMIQVTQGNIKRLKAKLAEMQANAADLERAGEKVSPRYLADMDSIRRQISDAYASIVAREADKQDIRDRFDNDLDRFRKLRSNTAVSSIESEEQSRPLDMVVPCRDAAHCEQLWQRASAYVEQHATTPVQLAGDKILMTASPREDKDISLTVSLIPNKDGPGSKIFLDVQCRDTPVGKEFCETESVTAIKSGFRHAIGGN